MKVFVLEDDPSVQATLRQVLGRRLGREPFVTAQWPELVKWISTERSRAALVCDLQVGGIRGEDFCRTIQKHHPGVPIVLFSGVAEPELEATARRLGVSAVAKRLGANALAEELVRILATPEQPEVRSGRPTSRLTSAPAPPSHPVPAAPVAFLVGHGLEREVPIVDTLLVGRGDDPDVVLNQRGVSRRHVEVSGEGAAVTVRDLGSRNGTWLDGVPLQRAIRLERDAVVRIGPHAELRIVFGQAAASQLQADIVNGSTGEFLTPKAGA